MPKISEHSKNIPRLRKGQELFWDLHKIMKIRKSFLRLMFVSAAVSIVFMYNFAFMKI